MSQMIYVEAPAKLDYPSVFLAGGITDCPDWQSEVVEFLKPFPIRVYNPRRANFPIGNPDAAQEQIAWEFYYLTRVNFIFFWFPKETLCPIVLYELGRYANAFRSCSQLAIGTHHMYKRRDDVIIQTELAHGKELEVHAIFTETIFEMIQKLDEQYKILEAIKYPHKFMNKDIFGDLFQVAAAKVRERKQENDKADSQAE